MAQTNSTDKKIKIIELSTPDCTHCAKAKEILEKEIKPNFPNVEIEYNTLICFQKKDKNWCKNKD